LPDKIRDYLQRRALDALRELSPTAYRRLRAISRRTRGAR
jgi:hypothetical protein